MPTHASISRTEPKPNLAPGILPEVHQQQPQSLVTKGLQELSSSPSVSSQQLHTSCAGQQTVATSSAEATNTIWQTDQSNTAPDGFPPAQQPKASTADSPSDVHQSNWRLDPVVKSTKLGRLKRKFGRSDQPGSPACPSHMQEHEQAPRCKKAPSAVDSHVSQPACSLPEVPIEHLTQHIATDTLDSEALCNEPSSASLPQQSCQQLPSSALTGCDAAMHCPQAHAAVSAGYDSKAAPHQGLSLVQQTPSAAPTQLLTAQGAAQNRRRHLLRERAKGLQLMGNHLLAEAEQCAPRTTKAVQDEAERQHKQHIVQALRNQHARRRLARAAAPDVQVPIQRLPSQAAAAAEAAQRGRGLAVRDCALPLQDGRLMCAEAQPYRACISELRQAAACQQIAADEGDL